MPSADRPSDLGFPERRGASPLSATLKRLKREGCSVLVCGVVGDAVRAEMTRRLFGSTEADRWRILGRTSTASLAPSAYFPVDLQSDRRAVVVSHPDAARTRATADGIEAAPVASERQQTRATSSEIAESDALRAALTEAVLKVAGHNHLSPGVLRVGVTSVGAFLDSGVDEVIEFVRTVESPVHAANGIFHVHAPLSHDDDRIAALLPHFDVRIDLRISDPLPPEHRWYLPAVDERTTWMRL
ncbi:hypothetical protein ACFQPA_18900 [Halomarina halobia]|uniref:Uncharacterized protein n=1 Tax=Halomarina halobia TaxID=3033386 RepID=A0ABD6ACI3_9EURY|nr:hypothetical protein [Halomarina sp. PSR21]